MTPRLTDEERREAQHRVKHRVEEPHRHNRTHVLLARYAHELEQENAALVATNELQHFALDKANAEIADLTTRYPTRVFTMATTTPERAK